MTHEQQLDAQLKVYSDVEANMNTFVKKLIESSTCTEKELDVLDIMRLSTVKDITKRKLDLEKYRPTAKTKDAVDDMINDIKNFR